MGAQHKGTEEIYTYTTRSKSATSRMPRPSVLLSLVTVGSLLLLTIDASPVFVDNPSLAQFQSGRNIRHLPCIVRKSGRSGVCMFAIDCIKQNGTHLGTCIDRFYFGSCCALKEEASLFAPEINDNSIDQNTISHFSHESTTLPTSALFMLTTENGPLRNSSSTTTHHSHPLSQQTTNELLKNVTQSYLSTAKPVRTTASNSNSSSAPVTTRRPPQVHTTHKNSHFVVRTTLKPSGVSTNATTTTVKPPRRHTTTAKPVLTTAVMEQRIETTTVPTKFVTFQIVETTTPPVTESVHLETTTITRRRTRPTSSSSVGTSSSRTTSRTTTSTATATTPPTTTTTVRQEVTTPRPTPPLRTTTAKPHKPQSSRRPTPSKKPVVTVAPTVRGSQQTRKPVNVTTTLNTNGSTLQTKKPIIPLISSTLASTTTSTSFKDELKNNRTVSTTQAPRPKPKPTAEIVKVTAFPVNETFSDNQSTTSNSAINLVTKNKPSGYPASATTPSIPKPTRPISTKTTPKTTTPTSTTTTTRKPPTTSAKPLPTTEAPTRPPTTSTSTTTSITKKPGLITWTDVKAEPPTNASISDGWQPAPPSDWEPLTTQKPNGANETATTTAPPNATDKVVVSIATSVSAAETHETEKPHKITKPPKFSTTSRPKTTSTTATTAATTTTAGTSTTKTTDSPTSSIELAASTSSATEVASSSSSVSTTSTTSTTSSPATTTSAETTDYSGEEPSTSTIEATGSTTVASVNALEGVDYKEVCGRRMFPEPRIVGGANAAFGRWPWQISLRQWRTSTYLHKCGAALLNENWAITAAHCVDNVPPSDLLLRLGEYDLAEEEEPYGYQERRVQIVASHPQFDPRTFEYDLALLRFYEPVVFQPNIIPVCVPENDENFIGQTAFVTGWGRLYEDGPLPSVLQEVAVPVINNTICESMYRAAGYIEHIPHIFICAGWKKGGYDSCEGDSGGPMVLQRESDKRFHLGGVISWGIGCAEANQPGVYTRISEFRDWINQILQF
ncbi:hypothetical protein KR018_004420 [Drosophila ironensis]|nr:hypothetical protein KR018_004420 [Drosophila ironensis]